jgi:hypothetical protein
MLPFIVPNISESRPTGKNAKVRAKIKEEVKKIIVDYMDSSEIESAVDFIVDNYDYGGYELAKHLDEEFGVEPDMNLIESLDDIGFTAHTALREEIKRWVREAGIVCPFAIGRRVKFKEYEGEISVIYQDQGECLIYCENLGHVRSGRGTNGFVASYEDLKPAD